MRLRRSLIVALALQAGFALPSNAKDEQAVRTAYAKVAYAVQSRTVYLEATKHPDITAADLTKKLQANELRFDISEMSSGSIADILDRPYSDFVSKPDKQQVLQITHYEETATEKSNKVTTYSAEPVWKAGGVSSGDWDRVPVKTAIARSLGTYSRYVTATITVRFQNQSRTYRTLWLFSDTDLMAIDTVTGNYILRRFATESAYPSVLTDTGLRAQAAVNDWLTSTQSFDASCKPGKADVCCDSASMHCGVSADDLRSTKPAPKTTAMEEKL